MARDFASPRSQFSHFVKNKELKGAVKRGNRNGKLCESRNKLSYKTEYCRLKTIFEFKTEFLQILVLFP